MDIDELARAIITANGLDYAEIDVYGSDEYWIRESLCNLSDLGDLYDNYVKNSNSTDLVDDFIAFTGYNPDND